MARRNENSSIMMFILAIRRQPAMDLLGSRPSKGGKAWHRARQRVIRLCRLVVMEGDGIGPEITAATMAVLRAADDIFKLGLSFTPVAIGLAALRAQGTTLPQAAVDAAKAADGVILGPVSHNDYPPLAQGGLNPSGELRKRLDLFANIRP